MNKYKVILSLFLISVISLTLTVVLTGYFLLNSQEFWQKMTRIIMETQKEQGALQSLKVERVESVVPATISFVNLDVAIVSGGDSYQIYVKNLKFDFRQLFLSKHKTVTVTADGIRLNSPKVSFENGRLNGIVSLKDRSFSGPIVISSLEALQADFQNFSAQIEFMPENILLKNVKTDLYNGQLTAELKYQLVPQVFYQAEVKFSMVDIGLMRDVNKDVFSHLRGQSQGHMVVTGSAQNVDKLSLNINVPMKAQIRAGLLKTFIDQLPKQTQQRKDLDLLLKTNGFIALDTAQMDLESVSSRELKGQLNLSSKRFDLNMALSSDIHLDGNLRDLFGSFEKIFNNNGGDS